MTNTEPTNLYGMYPPEWRGEGRVGMWEAISRRIQDIEAEQLRRHGKILAALKRSMAESTPRGPVVYYESAPVYAEAVKDEV